MDLPSTTARRTLAWQSRSRGRLLGSMLLVLAVGGFILAPAFAPARPAAGIVAGGLEAGPGHGLALGPAESAVQVAAGTDPLNHTVGWSEIAPPPSGFGSNGGIATDSSAARAILFGGVSASGLVNTTYVYNETLNSWMNISGALAPSPRSDFAFAFDPALGVGALFGGLTNLTSLAASNQTWEVSSTGVWKSVPSGMAPPAREGAAFAIAPSLGIGLLYGGWNRSYSSTSSITYSDVWELNLTTWAWSQLTVAGTRPPPLEGASMTWDPGTLRFEMYGGCYPCSSVVWEFDPGTGRWSELTTSVSAPPGRGYASWAYDPTLDEDLLFGGTGGGAAFNDTYLFSPSNDTWLAQTLPPHPSGRYGADSGFLDVPGNETWLLAGGLSGAQTDSDLWRLSATSNLSFQVVNASNPSSPLNDTRVDEGGRTLGVTNTSGYLNLTQVNGVGQPLEFTNDPWYVPRNLTLWAPPGRNSSFIVGLTPQLPGTVNVEVLTSNNLTLPSAVTNLSVDGVLINPLPHLTNMMGTTSFYGAPPGRANVTAWLAGWRHTYALGTLPPGGTLNETLVLVPEPVLSVLVLGRLPEGGSPVPLVGAIVLLDGVDLGVTNSTGGVSAVTDAYGNSSVEARADDFYPGNGIVNVPWTGSVNFTLTLEPLPFGTLEVTVENKNTSQPIAEATVTASTTVPLGWGAYSASNQTDSFGSTKLPLPEGQYSLVASATGYYSSSPSPSIAILPDSSTSFVIDLLPIPPAKVHVLVQDALTLAPIAGATVDIVGVGIGATDGHGLFNAPALIPGPYLFVCSAIGYFNNSTLVTLQPNENLTLVVNLTRLPAILGPGSSAWSFNLFPGGTAEIWPFLAGPLFLIVGGFVYVSVRRAVGSDERSRTSASKGGGKGGTENEAPVTAPSDPPRPPAPPT